MRTGSKLKCHSISFTSLYPSDLVSTAFMTCVVDTRYCLWEARPANKLSRRQREAYTAPPTVGGVIQRGGASIAGNNGGGLPGEPAAHACDMAAGILQPTRTLAGNTQAYTHRQTHTRTHTNTQTCARVSSRRVHMHALWQNVRLTEDVIERMYNSYPDSQDNGDVWWPDIANSALGWWRGRGQQRCCAWKQPHYYLPVCCGLAPMEDSHCAKTWSETGGNELYAPFNENIVLIFIHQLYPLVTSYKTFFQRRNKKIVSKKHPANQYFVCSGLVWVESL